MKNSRTGIHDFSFAPIRAIRGPLFFMARVRVVRLFLGFYLILLLLATEGRIHWVKWDVFKISLSCSIALPKVCGPPPSRERIAVASSAVCWRRAE